MRFPLSLTTSMAGHMLRQKLAGVRRFPLVLMLEPLHACNLTCTGCGRIREYKSTIKEKLTLQECLDSVDECGAPVVSICGGEPLIYPEIAELTARTVKRRKTVYLCTNGVFLAKKLPQFKPTSQLYFNIHLDGLEATHDLAVERDGVFKAAVEGIKAAKAAGFQVCTNTTIYKETDMGEIDALFGYLTRLGVDGFMLSPAYGYAAVCSTNPQGAAEIFLTRDEIIAKFREGAGLFRKYKMNTSPVYAEFLRGERELDCAAWASPTRNVKGWKGPCYLITDTHYDTYRELIDSTNWDDYGRGKDERCDHCMVHCGYEMTASLGMNAKWSDPLKMMMWQFT